MDMNSMNSARKVFEESEKEERERKIAQAEEAEEKQDRKETKKYALIQTIIGFIALGLSVIAIGLATCSLIVSLR